MTDSIFKNNVNKRTADFRINPKLNIIINELSYLLKPIQEKKQQEFKENKYPIIFIIGTPRSGTTILLQWLASLNIFSYPTNVLNRFAYAPYLGALIQQILFNPDYDFKNELNNFKKYNNFKSYLGKTKGALGVNEFQNVFRNYMPNFDPEFLNTEQLRKVNFQGLKKCLASIENVFNKPFVMKAIMLQFNLDEFYKYIKNVIFIFIKRIPIYNMQSLLIAREKYYFDKNIWWSVKPKEYSMLKKKDIYHQIAGQVYYTNKTIEMKLKNIPESKKLILTYEKFCREPEIYFHLIKEKYELNGYHIDESYTGVNSLINKNEFKISKYELKKFAIAYNNIRKNASNKWNA